MRTARLERLPWTMWFRGWLRSKEEVRSNEVTKEREDSRSA
jgi:hypothetical protein